MTTNLHGEVKGFGSWDLANVDIDIPCVVAKREQGWERRCVAFVS